MSDNRGTRLPKSIGAALLALAALVTTAAAQPDDRQGRRAKQEFGRGVQLYEEGDYVGAIEAFKRAYVRKPHFHVQCNIARSHEQLSDLIRARDHYRQCLAGARGSKRAAVQADLAAVEAKIARLEVTSPRAAVVLVDGRSLGRTPARVAVNPGLHLVEVRWQGGHRATIKVSVRVGERRTVAIRPPPSTHGVDLPPAQKRPAPAGPTRTRRRLSQWWFWSGVGVTAVLAGLATWQGVETLRRVDQFDERPTRDNYDRAVSRRLVTNILWGGVVVAGGASATLFFFTDFGGGERPERVVGLGYGGSF